jgi:hypothetical protein
VDQGLLGFATLLIGLAAGRQPVELLVSRPVASVRLLLDGREVAALSQPPWRAVLDLGAAPSPHRVDAVGFDRAGAEVARAVQWVNLPRPEAALDLVLERDDSGRATGVRLAWESSRPEVTPVVRAVLDGQPLSVTGADRVALTGVDALRPHFLRVEADFGGGKVASREIAFGGAYADTGASSLTALPAAVASGRKEVTAQEVRVQLTSGEPLPVVAVEHGSARVAVVIDRRALDPLRAAAHIGETDGPLGPATSRRWGNTYCGMLRRPPRPGEDEVLLIDPQPGHFVRNAADSCLFTARRTERTRARDLMGVVTRALAGPADAMGQWLTNAVATAGLLAASGGHRRAVVLIVGAANGGDGDLVVADVQAFLRLLGVPLYVWSPVAAVVAGGAGAWGPVQDATSCADLGRAAERLGDDLERQRTVWVEGLHLPQDLVLSSSRLVRLE